MACVSAILAMNFMLFYDTILSDHMLDMEVSDKYIGFIFALGCFAYTIFCPFVGLILHKGMPKVFLTQFAFCMAFISLILMGPSEVLGLPNKVAIIIPGMFLLGMSNSFIFVPLLPEIIDAV